MLFRCRSTSRAVSSLSGFGDRNPMVIPKASAMAAMHHRRFLRRNTYANMMLAPMRPKAWRIPANARERSSIALVRAPSNKR
jgi:hypothetical protein